MWNALNSREKFHSFRTMCQITKRWNVHTPLILMNENPNEILKKSNVAITWWRQTGSCRTQHPNSDCETMEMFGCQRPALDGLGVRRPKTRFSPSQGNEGKVYFCCAGGCVYICSRSSLSLIISLPLLPTIRLFHWSRVVRSGTLWSLIFFGKLIFGSRSFVLGRLNHQHDFWKLISGEFIRPCVWNFYEM